MKADTVHVVLGKEQAERLITDLQNSLNAGAESIILITSNEPEAQKKLEQLKSHWAAGTTASLMDAPEPTIATHNSLFTVALPIELDELLKVYEMWSE